MDDRRQKIQLELALVAELKGEARRLGNVGTESATAERETESLAEDCMLHRPLNLPNRRVRTRTHGGVGGVEPRGLPLSRLSATISPARQAVNRAVFGENSPLAMTI